MVIITGAAGFIGFHLAQHLLAQGHRIKLLDNLQRGAFDEQLAALANSNLVDFVRCDLTDKDAVEAALDCEFTGIYHLAAVNGTESFYKAPDFVLKTNVLSTFNILDVVKERNDVKVVYASSSEVYASSVEVGLCDVPTGESVLVSINDMSNPRWSYAVSKICGESACFSYQKNNNFRFAIVRYHNIYGPRMGFGHVIPEVINRVLSESPPLKIFGAEPTRAFCYVSDAVSATVMVMTREETDSQIIHIGNDEEEIAIRDLVQMILITVGLQVDIDEQPAPKGSVARRCPDISKVKNLGFVPRVSLQQGLQVTAKWYTNYLHERS